MSPTAVIAGHPPAPTRARVPDRAQTDLAIADPSGSRNPYTNEWNDLLDAIRNDKPYNEVKRGVQASLASSMGRMAAHTAREITFEEMLNSEHEYASGVDKWTMDSPAPLQAGPDGKYPVPQPGLIVHREY